MKDYPEVRVGDASQRLDSGQPLIRLAGTLSEHDVTHEDIGSGFDENGNSRSEATITVYGRRHGSLYGCPLIIVTKHRSDPSSTTSVRATAGGIVVAGGKAFYLTAGHAFETPSTTVPIQDEEDFEFDIGQNSDSEGEPGFIETTSRGSLSPETTEYDESDGSGRSLQPAQNRLTAGSNNRTNVQGLSATIARQLSNDNPKEPDLVLPLSMDDYMVMGDLREPANGRPMHDLDYALIEVRPEYFDFKKFTDKAHERTIPTRHIFQDSPRESQVYALTGSVGKLQGTISGTPTYSNRPGSKAFQKLWTVRLSGKLEVGDCGSWVLESHTGMLLGHIVAGSPESGVAYILPAQQIFDDALGRYGLDLHLPVPLQINDTPAYNEKLDQLGSAGASNYKSNNQFSDVSEKETSVGTRSSGISQSDRNISNQSGGSKRTHGSEFSDSTADSMYLHLKEESDVTFETPLRVSLKIPG